MQITPDKVLRYRFQLNQMKTQLAQPVAMIIGVLFPVFWLFFVVVLSFVNLGNVLFSYFHSNFIISSEVSNN